MLATQMAMSSVLFKYFKICFIDPHNAQLMMDNLKISNKLFIKYDMVGLVAMMINIRLPPRATLLYGNAHHMFPSLFTSPSRPRCMFGFVGVAIGIAS